MRTKQEIIVFLESKVGGGVKCIGNPSLDNQCVTLIKSLMEYLGVPDPYKARGHAKDCISNYLSEGIAKPGLGFISVFSNKDMGATYGHIWCNAGEGDGVFYESNGVKPLIVTKGKTYAYDAVCNFDSYIGEPVEDPCLNYKKELDEKRQQISNYDQQVAGLLGEKKQLVKQIEDLNTQLGSVRGELASSLAKIDSQNKTILSYVNEDAVQLETLKRLEGETNEYKNRYFSLLNDFQFELKLPKTTNGTPEELKDLTDALGGLIDTNESYAYKVRQLNTDVSDLIAKNEELIKQIQTLKSAKLPIDKQSTKSIIIYLLQRLTKGTV